MAQTNDSNLIVLVMAAEAGAAPQLAEQASAWLKERVPHADYRYLPSGNGDALIVALQENEKGLVVLGGESELLQGGALQRLLDELDCPVMLVR
jgi:nucleotide-binding universal stress UspA family protein